jgi:4-aminobutyrate aminotransferase-like enzyme
VRISPPMSVNAAELDEALAILSQSFAAIDS